MLQSLPNQTRKAQSGGQQIISSAIVGKLTALGFTTNDCIYALEECGNQLDEAALWLTQNAEPVRSLAIKPKSALDITAIQLRQCSISICVIDDCKDADVPLLELSVTGLDLRQELTGSDVVLRNEIGGFKAGNLKGSFSSDYYNRALSGWEPLIEPWNCEANWSYSLGQNGTQSNRLHLTINSEDQLKLNITSTIVELYQLVHENWTQDYYNSNMNNKMIASPTGIRRRTPFIPFALKNETGLKLWFTTLVSSPGGVPRTEVLTHAETKWNSVEPGQTATFSFGQQNKLRHRDTHKLTLHQVGVRVDGWTEVGPVSVDRVGVYFRHARHINEFSSMPRSRIVFSVSLEGSAQKLVTVRSALRLINRLDNPMLVKMEHLFGHLHIRNWPDSKTAIVTTNEIFSIPLSHVHSFLYMKPLSAAVNFEEKALLKNLDEKVVQKFDGKEYWKKYESIESGNSQKSSNIYQFCEKSVHWKDTLECVDQSQELRNCKGNRDKCYRMVVAYKKEGYPSKENVPGHTITLWPPLRLHNLLPCDLLYRLQSGTHGRISSTQSANIHEIDLEKTVEIFVTLDSYPGAGHITVQNGYFGLCEIDVKLTDVTRRVLNLKASIQNTKESGIQISISAPYWLVNRTGLPLVIRQEGVATESAGQFSEHEQARLVSPLMFSFTDPDGSRSLTVRLGKRYGNSPTWCQPFTLHKDILHRQLKASSNFNETYIIGIEVRRGRGRYSRTSVVTFSPRFQLYNRSSYKLQFAQKCYALTLVSLIFINFFVCFLVLQRAHVGAH